MTEAPVISGGKRGRALSGEFNSWVVGGSYSRSTLKRQQIKADLALKKAGSSGPSDDEFQQRIERRREELRQARAAAATVTYKSKVQAALREHPSRSSAAATDAGPASQSPRRRLRDPSPPKDDEAEDASSHALRERLKVSFAQTTAAHAYGTLFPPLLTPYNRHVATRSERPESPTREGSGSIDVVVPSGPRPLPPRESFSAMVNARQRVQPVSGPKAFFPTGSAATAYRCFAHHAHANAQAQTQAQSAALASQLRPTVGLHSAATTDANEK